MSILNCNRYCQMPSKQAALLSIPNHQLCTLLIIKGFNFRQSSGWKMVFYFNSLITCQLQPIFIYWLLLFLLRVACLFLCPFHMPLKQQSLYYKCPRRLSDTLRALWLVSVSSGGAEPGRTHGWKGRGWRFGIKVKKIRKSFGY